MVLTDNNNTFFGKGLKLALGLSDVSLVPSCRTVDMDLVDISVSLAGFRLDVPIIASAMDSVVDVATSVKMSQYGGLGVLNLEGVQTRYRDPDAILSKIASVGVDEYVSLMQEIYKVPVDGDLVIERIQAMKSQGAVVAVSATPKMAAHFGQIAQKAGADIFVVQSTVMSKEFVTDKEGCSLDLETFCQSMDIPVLLGNTTSYESTYQLLGVGAQGIFVGVGPGAACTTRGVLGIGVPMVSAVLDSVKARNQFFSETGTYVSIIADGGFGTSGDICKILACGADAVMIGSPLARSLEAPGKGAHWGMATPNAVLPRGARIHLDQVCSLETIMLGPSSVDDGTQNLKGAIETCFATLGVGNMDEMHKVEVIYSPSFLHEGKFHQRSQGIGMHRT